MLCAGAAVLQKPIASKASQRRKYPVKKRIRISVPVPARHFGLLPSTRLLRIYGTFRPTLSAFESLKSANSGHFNRSEESSDISYGVYQIGDVYARSVTVIGTSSGIVMPKYLASKAVQRGVGISMTRT